MCNAWNHPPGCTCGWGGKGHLGRHWESIVESYSQPLAFTPSLDIQLNLYESYVNPNAICPVCGTTVFFYQSPYGGRVFFDELGPPWTKHLCTDNNESIVLPESKNPIFSQWQFSWKPFRLDFYDKLSDRYSVISGIQLSDRNYSLPIEPLKFLIIEKHEDFENQTIRFIMKTNGSYRIDFLDKEFSPQTIKAWQLIRMKYLGSFTKSTYFIEPANGSSFHKCLIHKAHLNRESLRKIKINPTESFEFIARIESFVDGNFFFKEVNPDTI